MYTHRSRQCIIGALTTLSRGVFVFRCTFFLYIYIGYVREKPIIFAFIINTRIMFNNVLRTFLPDQRLIVRKLVIPYYKLPQGISA